MTPKQSKDVDNSPLISDCHNASMHVVSDSFGEGTNHYECDVCNEFCSFHTARDSSPSLEESKQLIEQFAPPTPSSLREQIILILGNALYVGKSIEQISKITKKQLAPFETATDQIMSLVASHIETAKIEARIDEVVKVKVRQVYTGWAGTHAVYQSSFNADERLKELQAQKAVLETRDE